MRYSDNGLLDALASTYVLGTLEGGARRRFERLQQDRGDVRMRVIQWEQCLGQLALSVPAHQPSLHLWPAIAARTQPEPAPRQTSSSRWSKWLRPAGVGLGGVVAGVIAASALFVSAPSVFISIDQFAMRSGEHWPQGYVGVLNDAQGQGRLLVSSLRRGKTLRLEVLGAPIARALASDEWLVLWALPDDGAPFAIGVVPATGFQVSTMPDTSEKLLFTVSRLIVTRERSATPSQPSTEVMLSGSCAKLG
ncbi:anti-sigma factor [Variovorax fucosicus]|uniref:anti-sigma factor n=1 Tax=Variovorax fucosicus TaxID=3053517 RepID=UPI002578DF27|nr:anti-sigma factor [Variovorax sp. J22G47]MDM0059114.1 anti-sigma factor [Variovorax sp. J22G47]